MCTPLLNWLEYLLAVTAILISNHDTDRDGILRDFFWVFQFPEFHFTFPCIQRLTFHLLIRNLSFTPVFDPDVVMKNRLVNYFRCINYVIGSAVRHLRTIVGISEPDLRFHERAQIFPSIRIVWLS